MLCIYTVPVRRVSKYYHLIFCGYVKRMKTVAHTYTHNHMWSISKSDDVFVQCLSTSSLLGPPYFFLDHKSLHWLTLHEQPPSISHIRPSARAPKHVLSPTGSLAASRLGWSGRLQAASLQQWGVSLSLQYRNIRINDELLIKMVALQWQQQWLEFTRLIVDIFHWGGNCGLVFPHVVLSHPSPVCPQRSEEEHRAAD